MITNGQDFLLKLRDPAKDRFTTVMGLRLLEHSPSLTHEGAWMRGSGLVKDEETDALLRQHFWRDKTDVWSAECPGSWVWHGNIRITRLSYLMNEPGPPMEVQLVADTGAFFTDHFKDSP